MEKLHLLKYEVANEVLPQYFIEKYSLVYDDFLYHASDEAMNSVLDKMNLVLNGRKAQDNFFGEICLMVQYNKDQASLFAYKDLLGTIKTSELYILLKTYQEHLGKAISRI